MRQEQLDAEYRVARASRHRRIFNLPVITRSKTKTIELRRKKSANTTAFRNIPKDFCLTVCGAGRGGIFLKINAVWSAPSLLTIYLSRGYRIVAEK